MDIEFIYKSHVSTQFLIPSEKQVLELESRIGVKLPESLRRFILQHNGGFFKDLEFTIKIGNAQRAERLDFISGVNAQIPVAELGRHEDLEIFENNVPPRLLPIGYTAMGSMPLVSTQQDDSGTIYLKFAHDERIFFLAENIFEFLEACRAVDE